MFVIIRNWETAKALTKLLLLGLAGIGMIAVVVGFVLLVGASILNPVLRPPSRPRMASAVTADSSNDAFVQLVQNWRATPASPIFRDVVARFFGDARWEHFKAEDGTDNVNLYANLNLDGNVSKAVLQFIANVRTNSVEVHYVQLNGVAQDHDQALKLFATLYK